MAGTVSGDDSSEESDCDSDRSSIFDRLMAKLLGNAEQENSQVEEECSSWMGELARSSWRQDKSARNWARYRAGKKQAMTAGLGPETDGLGASSCLSDRQTSSF